MTIVERTNLSAGVDATSVSLGGVRDDRVSSPLAQLTYRLPSDGDVDGDALVVLPSGRYFRIRNYSESVGRSAFGLWLFVDTGEPHGVVDEFLSEIGLDRSSLDRVAGYPYVD